MYGCQELLILFLVGDTLTISLDLYTRFHVITLLDEDGSGSIRAGA